MKSPVTMRDVAQRAGVTPTVVSRVLHNKATSIRVSEATAERVRVAARDLGYRVNVFARNFRERQTNMIGVLHGVGFSRPTLGHGSRYFAALMDGIVEGAFRHGYAVTLCPKLMGQTPEDAMSDGRFDGLIWYSTVPSEPNSAMLRACTSPLVMVHAQAEEFRGCFPIVSCDNTGGIELALEHLAELGHRRIALARGPEGEFSESDVREQAYFAWMRRHGLPLDGKSVIRSELTYEGVDDYLAAGPRHTAVLAHNEEMGAAFVRLAAKRGVRVPEELSVVGFDSTSYCNETDPPLTAIRQPLEALGERAVEMLIARLNGDTPAEAGPAPFVQIACGFDVRGSTAPPSK